MPGNKVKFHLLYRFVLENPTSPILLMSENPSAEISTPRLRQIIQLFYGFSQISIYNANCAGNVQIF